MTARNTDKRSSRNEQQELFSGLSVTKLALGFRMTQESIRRKLAGVEPIGYYKGAPRYDVFEAAQVLVKPKIDARFLRSLRPKDLPAGLQKDFWNAQNARLKFEEEAGDLWRTERVRQAFGLVFKAIRQSLTLVPDTLERQMGLSNEQRDAVQAMMDKLMEDVHTEISKYFEHFQYNDEHPDTNVADEDVDLNEFFDELENDKDEGL